MLSIHLYVLHFWDRQVWLCGLQAVLEQAACYCVRHAVYPSKVMSHVALVKSQLCMTVKDNYQHCRQAVVCEAKR